MKKLIAIVLVLGLLVMAGCTNKQNEPTTTSEITSDTTNIEKIANSFVDDILARRYTEAYDDYEYNEKLKKAINVEFYETKINPYQDKFGEVVEIKEIYTTKVGEEISISFPIVFENQKMNYIVTFDSEEKISGFHLKPYKEGETKESTVSESNEQNKKATIEETAKNFVMDLLNGDYEKAYTEYAHDDTMKAQVNADAYKAVIEDLKAKNGDFQEMAELYTHDVGTLKAVALPIKLTGQSVNFDVYFDSNGKIAGFRINTYQEKIETKIPENIIEQDLVAKVNGMELGGTLTLPKGDGEYPCVVLVHGSGATNRDEKILQNAPFRDIAWGLAQKGIAVYRYDKRNFVYPEQFKTGYDLTIYDETINDAVEIVKMLNGIDGIKADEIYVLGHSLGGYAMPRIAKDSSEAAGFILMAGSARGMHIVIPKQYDYLFNLDGKITDEEQAMLDATDKEVEKIKNIDDYDDTEIFMGAYKAYMKDMISYDPIDVASSIEKPVLVLQGERDYQVTMEDYNMWHDAYGDKENWTFVTYPKLNHLMIAGEGVANNHEYSIAGSVEQKVIDDIAEFVKE